MSHPSKPFLIAGNWKMNLTIREAESLSRQSANWALSNGNEKVDLLICPSYVHLLRAFRTDDKRILQIGAQDCSAQDNGAHTGDVSAAMLKDIGCQWVILGHSERRQIHKETNEAIQEKVSKAISEDLDVILCVGETLQDRESGRAQDVVRQQLEDSLPQSANGDNCVIAYEPVWAIGTGKVASASDVEEMHSFIDAFLSSRLEKSESLRIIYGGSVKPDNATELLSLNHVAGALIGGASLKADSFLSIADCAATL